MATSTELAGKLPNETTELSEKYEELEGTGPEPFSAFQALKEKIKLHYDLASDYYLSLWGEHIHHGYFTTPTQTKEDAQIALINLLLEISSLTPNLTPSTTTSSSPPLRILDVGCGIGGTTRYLATHLGAHVTGITISTRQVEIAKKLSLQQQQTDTTATSSSTSATPNDDGSISIGSKGGSVRFIELDAEKMGEYFSSSPSQFDVVWISEALSHFPNKPLFFQNACRVLKSPSSEQGASAGKLVIADWFKSATLTAQQQKDDIAPIEAGMLLPPLCTADEYVDMATSAGLTLLPATSSSTSGEKREVPLDISDEVKRTWDITWSLIQSPSLWAFAFSQGRDGLAFLQSFRAMRRGYGNGSFRYAVIGFEKR